MKRKTKQIYCPHCGEEVEAILLHKEESNHVKGDGPFTITAIVPVCPLCQEELFDPQLENRNLKRAYTQYRKKHHLLQHYEIKALRRRSRMTHLELGSLLGIKPHQLACYESGSIQTEEHDRLLRHLQTMVEFSEECPEMCHPRWRHLTLFDSRCLLDLDLLIDEEVLVPSKGTALQRAAELVSRALAPEGELQVQKLGVQCRKDHSLADLISQFHFYSEWGIYHTLISTPSFDQCLLALCALLIMLGINPEIEHPWLDQFRLLRHISQ